MAKVICVLNHKGGVGKTTTTANVAAGLNLLKKKVLMIDLDPQANLTLHFGFPQENENSIYEALKNQSALTIRNVPDVKGLDIVISSTDDMADIELQLTSVVGREYVLKELIVPIKSQYDYILVDCPPSLGILTLNALTCADMPIIVVEPAKFSLDGMKKIFTSIGQVQSRVNENLADFRVLVTRYNSNKVIHQNVVDNIRERFDKKVFKTEIRGNVNLEEAAMEGKDIFRYAPKSNGAADYRNVCNELVKRS
jgi:chromosome partitioning protein